MRIKKKSLDDRFDEYFEKREKLDKEYWKESEKLQDEYDALMKELEEK